MTPYAFSSREHYYSRPMQPTEPACDAATCASAVFTDKGKFSTTLLSHYPPRADLVRNPTDDSGDVATFAALDVFDAVSRATPPGDLPHDALWALPPSLPDGNYVLHLQVPTERDF